MVPSNEKATFFTGSFNFSGSLYRGFVATQTTLIDSINWGTSNGGAVGTVLSPKMTVAAGTDLNIKFSAIAATGSIVAYK